MTETDPGRRPITEARQLLEERKTSRFVLTEEFALRVRNAIQGFPDDVTFYDLEYWLREYPDAEVRNQWMEFYTGLSGVEKARLTHAVTTLANKLSLDLSPEVRRSAGRIVPREYLLRVNEFDAVAQGGLRGWRMGPFTAAFLTLAFSGIQDTAGEIGDN